MNGWNIKKYTFSIFVLHILFLCAFSLLLMKIYTPDLYNNQANRFYAYIALIINIITIHFSIKIYRTAPSNEHKILQWLVWTSVGLFLNNVSFFILVHMHSLEFMNAKFSIYILDFIPILVWVVSSIIFLSNMLLAGALSFKKLVKVLLPFLIINFMVIYLFLSSTDYLFPMLSWQNITHVSVIGMHFVIFDLAILCLVYSKQKGWSLLFSGFTILISGDTLVVYSSIAKTEAILAYGELLWVFGLLFILLGILTIKKDNLYIIKGWCNQSNMMKVKLTFWTFSASIAGFLLFFSIAFFFSIISRNIFLGLPVFITLYSIIIVVLSVFIGSRFSAPFKQIENNVRALMLEDDKSKMDDSFSTQEFMFLQNFIVDAFEFKEAKNIAQKGLTSLAAQVAHDIRSPLSALNTCLKYLPHIPESQRVLMRNAANRINDIANNLLQQYNAAESNTSAYLHSWLLAPLLESIISEKRLQFDGQPIHLQEQISSAGFFAFSKFDLKEMKRLLSNLINNAAEALPQAGGHIIITLDIHEEFISLKIKDNGQGIPEDKLAEILRVGVSFKAGGSGLGLPHAKEMIEIWGGTIELHSVVNHGTTINIQLPNAVPPQWFTSEIIVDPSVPIGILDDDQSVHDAWDQRLNAVSEDLSIHHFKTPLSFVNWYHSQTVPVQVLSDYELLGEAETGMDILEKLKINNDSILVTSHYENPDIIKRCQCLGIRLLPKNLLAHINMDLKKKENKPCLDLILIDDDIMLRKGWQLAADSRRKSIMTFASITEFEKILTHIDRSTPLYIDSELGGGTRGEECAKQLFEQGFSEIYLATGYPADHFDSMPWIRGITDKNPPF